MGEILMSMPGSGDAERPDGAEAVQGRRRIRTLSNQVRVGIFVCALVLLVPTTGLLISIGYQSLRRNVSAIQRDSAAAAATQITAYVEDLQRRLGYLSRLRGLTDLSRPLKEDILTALVRQNAAYEEVAFADPAGLVLVSIAAYGQPRSTHAPKAVSRAFSQGKDYVGPVELDPALGVPTFVLSVPVRDRHDNVAGILFARVNLRFLWAVITELKVGKTGYAYILDNRSYLLSEPGVTAPEHVLRDLSNSPAVVHFRDKPESDDSYRGLRGEDVLGGRAPVYLARWQVISEIPTKEAFAPIRQMLLVMAGAFAIATGMVIVAGIWFDRRMVAPLRSLTRAAGSLSDGNLDTRVTLKGESELAQLAHAYNHMASRLKTTIETLSRQVEETKRAVSARDNFLSVASHELKTPLTPLTLQLQLLQQRDGAGSGLPPAARDRLHKAVGVCVAQVVRLHKLVDQLLDVSRLTAGRLLIERERFDLRELVQEILEGFAHLLAKQAITVQVDAPTPVVGMWDRFRIAQVITNLLSNAIKYGEGKPIDVSVEALANNARLTVRDHGIGIPEEAIDRIFGRFERAVSERHFGGLGLGLYIAQSIVAAHGGTISVKSEAGQGATFVVDLPPEPITHESEEAP